MPGLSLEACGEVSHRISNDIDNRLLNPHRLEFERVCMPGLLVGKKTYAALKYEPKKDGSGYATKEHVRGSAAAAP